MPETSIFSRTIDIDQNVPQGLKPAFLLIGSGTAEAVPFPNPIAERLKAAPFQTKSYKRDPSLFSLLLRASVVHFSF